ncbi:MAG: hypothetical protein R2856_32445 [Caldilineaceae bacterium]
MLQSPDFAALILAQLRDEYAVLEVAGAEAQPLPPLSASTPPTS